MISSAPPPIEIRRESRYARAMFVSHMKSFIGFLKEAAEGTSIKDPSPKHGFSDASFGLPPVYADGLNKAENFCYGPWRSL